MKLLNFISYDLFINDNLLMTYTFSHIHNNTFDIYHDFGINE